MRLAALILTLAPMYAGQIVLGTNGIVNGDFESGSGSNDGSVVASMPGWTVLNSTPTVVQYGAAGGFPTLSDPGPAARGSNFFAGGPGTHVASLDQLLDVSNISSQIDASQVSFVVSGFFGGWQSQNDSAELVLFFRDGSNAVLNPSGFTLSGPIAADRLNQTGLLLEFTNGTIPVGTRTIEFVLNSNYTEGSYVDGYADNLSFIATGSDAVPSPGGVPEPGTMWMMAGAAALLLYRGSSRMRSSVAASTAFRENGKG